MKYYLALCFLLAVFVTPVWAAPGDLGGPAIFAGSSTSSTEENKQNEQPGPGTSATGFRPTNGVGGGSGTSFTAELTFLETLLSSNYVLFIGLVIAIIGFFQFIIHGNGFGIIMIILAVALTAFPGMYKSFYSGVRPFVHSAAGTDTTQPWR